MFYKCGSVQKFQPPVSLDFGLTIFPVFLPVFFEEGYTVKMKISREWC